jgi:phage baseplate assembly protein W
MINTSKDFGGAIVRSIKFPKMFNTNNTQVWKASEYNEATRQNTKLLLHCERGELIGDPYFGLLLKHFMFDPNSYVLRDQIIDMIYTQLATFIPQVKVERKDISVYQDREKGKLYCEFSGINQIDYVLNTYVLVLFDSTEISQ